MEKPIDLEPNSKPYLIKRIVADGFDTLVVFALFMLFTSIILKLPIAAAYQEHFDSYQAMEAAVIEKYQGNAGKITEALNNNSEYQYEVFAANLYSYLLKALACIAAEIPVLLVIPLVNPYGATLGKLMMGIVPFSERRQSRISKLQVVLRFLFIFLIDSLGLYLLTGILTFLLVLVLRLIEMLLNKKNKTLCDLITGVMIIEKLSYDGIN